MAGLLSGESLSLQGINVLYINDSECVMTATYLCAGYYAISPYNPPIRDENTTNDFQCVDILGKIDCVKGRRY